MEKLSTEAKDVRSRYAREWRRRNPEKNKEYIRTYWERRLLKEKAQQESEQKS